MSESNSRRWAISLFAEIALWLTIAATFLSFYIVRFHADIAVIGPHLTTLFTAWILTVSLRLVTWRLSYSEYVARWVDAVLIAVPLLIASIWYVLVLVGLYSWGRVTTWPLIRTYTLQYGYLMETLGLQPWLLPVAVAALSTGLILLTHRFLSKSAWCGQFSRIISRSMAATTTILLLTVSTIQIYKLSTFPKTGTQDPFSLSFFPDQGVHNESHILGNSPVLNAQEKAERANFTGARAPLKRNVILIVGDALRADHMSLYGYSRPTTKFLDGLAKSNQLTAVSQVRSVCAESACGLLALAASRPVHAMPSSPFTLQEALRKNGYMVNLILSGDHTNFYGLKDVYGKVDSYHDGTNQTLRYINDDRLVVDRINDVPDYDNAQPVMFQFHLMSAHGLGIRHKNSYKFMPFTNYYRWPQTNRVAPSAADIPKAVNYYDNGIVQIDQTIKAILEQLKQKGYLENAIVVITGDHGEMLGEHGIFGHQHRVEEAVLRIPLVVIRYGYEGSPLRAAFSSQIDIAPTILHELGLPAPKIWRGRALQNSAPFRFVYFQQSDIVGLYDLKDQTRVLKYWKDFATGGEYLFDIYADSLEQKNLIKTADPKDLHDWRQAVIPGSLVGKVRTPSL